jgi:alpha-1,2-mannosyltransferase
MLILNFLWILLKFAYYNILCILLYLSFVLILKAKLKTRSRKRNNDRKIISFMHPFCNDCGGGEKVLWMMIKGINENYRSQQQLKINVLCGTKDSADAIKQNLKDRFDIEFLRTNNNHIFEIELIRLKSAHLLKPKPMFTMIMQIIGQIVFAIEILTTVHSDYIIDTTGLPFTYFILRCLGRVKISSYTHYPFISSDMISDIQNGIQGVHSRGFFSKFKIMRYVKIFYYYLILLFYRFNGLFLEFVFCNSTWTYSHIKKIWPNVDNSILYPPCSTNLYENDKSNMNKQNIIVSFAQFRPEKNHKMQIEILKKLKIRNFCRDLKLCIIGTIRDESDMKIYEDVKNYIHENRLEESVELCPNLPFKDVKKKFEIAKIGLHTMRDEHFGISVIEMMAAGLITVAHKSAGPLNDIIGPSQIPVGILAESKKIIKFITIFYLNFR